MHNQNKKEELKHPGQKLISETGPRNKNQSFQGFMGQRSKQNKKSSKT